MDSMKFTLDTLSESINKRMEEFEAQLARAPGTPTSVSTLATEFAAYRTFVTQALKMLQQQVEALAHTVDGIEMHRRRKILLLHGIEEAADESPIQTVTEHLKKHLKITDLSAGDFKRCQRLGRATSTRKPRPVLVKFQDLAVRDKVWFNKSKLKGSGITMSEFLTKSRHDVFMAAREKFGVTKTWTRDGVVCILGANDVRYKVILSLAEMNEIDDAKVKPAAVTKTAATKPRRNASKK